MRCVNFGESLVQDVRYTIRSLAKSPGFTASVVGTLALGIGANAAIFALVHGVLLRPLEYPRPDQLICLTAEAPAIGVTRGALSAQEYIDFRRMSQLFAEVGAYSTGGAAYTTGEVNLTATDRPLRVRSISVDAHLLRALSIQPEQGRFFSDEETSRWTGTLAPPIAILSHELWRTAFGGRPLHGQKVEIEGRPHEIVGIMPAGIDVMDHHTQVWLPLWLPPNMASLRGAHVLYVIARHQYWYVADVCKVVKSRKGGKDANPKVSRDLGHYLALQVIAQGLSRLLERNQLGKEIDIMAIGVSSPGKVLLQEKKLGFATTDANLEIENDKGERCKMEVLIGERVSSAASVPGLCREIDRTWTEEEHRAFLDFCEDFLIRKA